MEKADVVVIGGGISGTAFAWKAAREGRRVMLLEAGDRLGGCLCSHRRADGYWFELGAHTTYNSYGGFLEIAEGCGATERLLPRSPARARFGLLRDGQYSWLTPPRLLRRFNWFEILWNFPRGILRSKGGRTMADYYGGLVGRANYGRLLSPFLAAVPSQVADGFPAAGSGSLFKKRPRRDDFPRSYGFDGGLQTVCNLAGGAEGVTLRKGVEVVRLSPDGDGFVVTTAAGEQIRGHSVAAAAPVDVVAAILRRDLPELSRTLEQVRTVEVESMGVVLPAERCWMPEAAFVVPVEDIFFSAVTRDPFPEKGRRAFTFHFGPGSSRKRKLQRMAEVLRVGVDELGEPAERRHRIPSPALGHDRIVGEIDRHLAGRRLALTGNYFHGLAIEDCVQRSFAELKRLQV